MKLAKRNGISTLGIILVILLVLIFSGTVGFGWGVYGGGLGGILLVILIILLLTGRL